MQKLRDDFTKPVQHSLEILKSQRKLGYGSTRCQIRFTITNTPETKITVYVIYYCWIVLPWIHINWIVDSQAKTIYSCLICVCYNRKCCVAAIEQCGKQEAYEQLPDTDIEINTTTIYPLMCLSDNHSARHKITLLQSECKWWNIEWEWRCDAIV